MTGRIELPVVSASATLRRHGVIRATGAARRVGKRVEVTLNVPRTLPRERYTLSLTYVGSDLVRRRTNNVVEIAR